MAYNEVARYNVGQVQPAGRAEHDQAFPGTLQSTYNRREKFKLLDVGNKGAEVRRLFQLQLLPQS